MSNRELFGSRYLTADNQDLKDIILRDLPYLDFDATIKLYEDLDPYLKDIDRALWNANDRYYLLTGTLHRYDAFHPWLFERCREVEANPDGYLDLWARYHYKSSIGTFAGCIQEIIRDPEITIGILSCTGDIAGPFLEQLQQEMENNEDLKRIHSDVFWHRPRIESPKWNKSDGLIVKRHGNPKEATVEAHGLIDAMPVGRHYRLLVYDDLVTERLVTNPEMIKKVTERWELSDNLGSSHGTRKWHFGTRYSFGDTYGVLLERNVLKERRYAATDDGTLKGKPIFLTEERWAEVKAAQKSTVNAQMLLDPLAGNAATFDATTFKHYDLIPAVMNVYIMCDPSKGKTRRSDRTAIAVIGIDPAGNKYLLDGYCHRMKLSQRYQYLKQLEQKWRNHPGVQLCRVGYEQYGMQTDLETIEETMTREGHHFQIEELNTTRDNTHSKNDRIERLEPEMRRGAFYLPAVVYHPDFGGRDGSYQTSSLWDVWQQEDFDRMHDGGAQAKDNPPVGTIVYRPMQGPTRNMRYAEATHQRFRIVVALKRKDENGDMYDLTRAFLEEAKLHPFAPHDDFLDAASRLYDMEPRSPTVFESMRADMPIHPDS